VPDQVALVGNFARAQLLARRTAADEDVAHSDDVTAQASYASSDSEIVNVTPAGQLQAVASGEAKILVTLGQERAEVAISVTDVVPQPEVGFTEQIRPILNKAGCAMAACHASQHGK